MLQVITITGTGDHHRLDQPITITGIRRDANGNGRLAVTWAVAGGGDGNGDKSGAGAPLRLVLDWVESGVDVRPETVTRRGHGSELIEDALTYSLRARTEYVLGHDGVRCRVEVPLA